MKMDVSDFGNLRNLSAKISLAHKSSGGKWLYMRETLEGVDKLANVGLLLLGKITFTLLIGVIFCDILIIDVSIFKDLFN